MADTEGMTKGEEEIAFYYTIGAAITEWAYVENTLRSLVLACFENKGDDDLTHRALSVGFFSIETFRPKMNFTEGVVKRRYGGHSHEWAKLVKRILNAARKRNLLAHWSVGDYPLNSPGRRLMLVPWIFAKRKGKPKKPIPPDGSQGLRDIAKMRMEFIALAIALHNFSCRIQGLPEPHPKSREQPGNPPPIRILRAQILEALARPLRPSG